MIVKLTIMIIQQHTWIKNAQTKATGTADSSASQVTRIIYDEVQPRKFENIRKFAKQDRPFHMHMHISVP